MFKITLINSLARGIDVTKKPYAEVIRQDVDEQARALVVMMERAIPYKVIERFCELTNADMNKIIEIGLSMTHNSGGRAKLTYDDVRYVRSMEGVKDARELAAELNILPTSIQNIWKRKTWALVD